MSDRQRVVDLAMQAERPAKKTVRDLWVAKVGERQAEENREFPLYLTLAGALGLDLLAMSEAGLLQLAESGAVAASDLGRWVAVESSPNAVVELQTAFPGIKVVLQPVQSLVNGATPFSWPTAEEMRLCCASVVNLDFNGAIKVMSEDELAKFVSLEWILKISKIHSALRPKDPWSLFLTFNAALDWPADAYDDAATLIIGNFAEVGGFEEKCRAFFGPSLSRKVEDTNLDPALPRHLRQRFLLVWVPKFLVDRATEHGWAVSVERSLHYLGAGGAPMVTWIIDFIPATRGQTKRARIAEGVRSILTGVGALEEDGSIS